MTTDASRTIEIQPDPRLEKRTHRRFSAADKLRLVTEAEALPHGDKGAWLRRNGLYAAQWFIRCAMVYTLRNCRRGASSTLAMAWRAFSPSRPVAKATDPRDRQIAHLQRDNARLHRRAEVAEQLVERKRLAKYIYRPCTGMSMMN